MKMYNFEQGSEEWKAIRVGKLTASDFHILMGDSKTKKTTLLKKAAERIVGTLSDASGFTSIHTERGKELEVEAREFYSILSTNEVEEVGFIEANEFLGCSPDGLIGEDGGLEIKCKDNHNHLFAVMNNYIEPSHRTQCQFNMYITGRKWWDYFLYNKNFANPGHIIRIERDDDYINRIVVAIEGCNIKIEEHIKKYKAI